MHYYNLFHFYLIRADFLPPPKKIVFYYLLLHFYRSAAVFPKVKRAALQEVTGVKIKKMRWEISL